ncbi:hypothetical protein CR513_00272, partial [Mucuna pruriens]
MQYHFVMVIKLAHFIKNLEWGERKSFASFIFLHKSCTNLNISRAMETKDPHFSHAISWGQGLMKNQLLVLQTIIEHFGNVAKHAEYFAYTIYESLYFKVERRDTYNNMANTIGDLLYWPIYIKNYVLSLTLDTKK